VAELPSAKLEVCSSNNYRATKLVVDELTARVNWPPHTRHPTPWRNRVIPRGCSAKSSLA